MCIAKAEIEAFSAENPELLKLFSFKPGLGQTIALDASLTARNYAGVIPAFLVHSDSFSLSPLNIKWRIT